MRKTREFDKWFATFGTGRPSLEYSPASTASRIGNAGDVSPVGEGISELRINYGPGYRVYFTQRGGVLVILLCGGDKGSQGRDIALAKVLSANMEM